MIEEDRWAIVLERTGRPVVLCSRRALGFQTVIPATEDDGEREDVGEDDVNASF